MADIGTAVAGFTAILEAEFDIPVIDKDIEEDFPRPAFIIQTENITHDRIGLYPHDNFDLEIYYFSPSRYSGYADLYGIMQKIQELLSVDRVTFPDGVHDTDRGTGLRTGQKRHDAESYCQCGYGASICRTGRGIDGSTQ